MDYRNSTDIENIFLTGGTGVLGSRVLKEILETTDATVYCLVRAKNFNQGKEKIENIFYDYDPDKYLEDELNSRVVCVLGDVSKKRLGIDKKQYSSIMSSIDLVIHSAANTSLIASYKKLKPINVDGTGNVVEFCLEANAPLLQVSSYSMIGDKVYEEVTFTENDFDIGQQFDKDHNYERTKFDGEKIVREARSRGLKWAIVRPGNIFGDTETGCYPLFSTKTVGIYYDLIKALVESGYSFDSVEPMDVSPVDYVAKALLYIALHIEDKTEGQTYHLVNQTAITYNQFVNTIREYGYTVRDVDIDEYIKCLKKKKVIRKGKPYSTNFTYLLITVADSGEDRIEKAAFETSKIKELLEDTDIECAKPDINLFRIYLDYAVKSGLFESPQQQVIAQMT